MREIIPELLFNLMTELSAIKGVVPLHSQFFDDLFGLKFFLFIKILSVDINYSFFQPTNEFIRMWEY